MKRKAIAALLVGSSLIAIQAAELADGIKAVVHDSVITLSDVEIMTAVTADVLARQYRPDTEAFEKKMEESRTENLQKAIGSQLILHEFKTAGYNLPDSVIEDEVQDRIRSKYGDRVHLTKSLQAEGITYEKFRQRIKDQFIVAALRQKNISSEIIVSPHKVEAYYIAHRDDFKLEDEVKLQMIVLKQDDKPEAASAEKRAEEILSKLKQGAKITEMAAVYSEGSQRKSDWGWWELSRLSKGLGDVAGSLPAGQFSKVMSRAGVDDYWMYQYDGGQPVLARHYAVDPATKKEKLTEERKLEGGTIPDSLPQPQEFYLMMVEDRRPAHLKPLGEVREQIEKDLILEERNRLEKQWIEKLKKKTFIRYF
jgi:peptidyl-prolyl cis-trans isomerase SurA